MAFTGLTFAIPTSSDYPAVPDTVIESGDHNDTLDALAAGLGVVAQDAFAFVDVASATTTDIGAATSNKVRITGTVTITGLGTLAAGYRTVRFAASLTLTHNATTLILPGGANIVTAANDTALFVSLGSGSWICVSYEPAAGLQPLDADLTAYAGLSSTGMVARTGSGSAAVRTFTGTSGEVTVTNGSGVSGNPTLSLPTALNFTGKNITNGTFINPAIESSFTMGSGGEQVESYVRGDEVPGYAVPCYRAVTANTPTALDIVPNGTPTIDAYGYAWVHVLKTDVIASPDSWQAITLMASSDKVRVGAMSTVDQAPLPLEVAGKKIYFYNQINGNEALTMFATLDGGGFSITNNGEEGQIIIFKDWAKMKSGYLLQWTADAGFAYGTADTGLSRNAAGVVEVNTGTAGTLASLKAACVRLAAVTVAGAPSASGFGAGSVIYVSDGDTGVPCLAVSNGTAWKRIALGATISAT